MTARAKPRVILAIATAWTLLAAAQASSQEFPIGIIDFYGLHKVLPASARDMLTFTEGDTISFASDEPPAFIAESEARLATLPGVAKAKLDITCCDNGRAIIYVGI